MRRVLIFFAVLMLPGTVCRAQNTDRLKSYDFNAALSEYRDSASVCADSLRREAFLELARMAENGITLTEFCQKPSVVARGQFPADDFFLYYPLPDRSWHKTGGAPIYYAGPAVDTLRLPARDSLELFPMVCGKDRFFASRTLPGMGGFDLFVSHWDESKQEWGAPRNMGIPFSSPYDDFLFINTEDGQYSIFASNRNCPGGMVNVYVLEYDSTPVCRAVSDPVELRRIAELAPEGRKEESAPRLDEQSRRYLEKVSAVRDVRSEVETESRNLDALRSGYLDGTGSSRASTAAAITEGEARLAEARRRLENASKALRDLEMEYMMNGVSIDLSKISSGPSGTGSPGEDYIFSRKTLGKPINFVYLKK